MFFFLGSTAGHVVMSVYHLERIPQIWRNWVPQNIHRWMIRYYNITGTVLLFWNIDAFFFVCVWHRLWGREDEHINPLYIFFTSELLLTLCIIHSTSLLSLRCGTRADLEHLYPKTSAAPKLDAWNSKKHLWSLAYKSQ